MLSLRHAVQWCALSLLLLVPSLALAQQHLLVAEDSTSAVAFRSQVGRVLTFICPARTMTNREIWGKDVYLVDSPICTAAAHAGVFTPGVSGQVTIVIGSGAQSFEGIGRNGVKSSSYGPGDAAYSFIQNGEPGQIDWITTLERVPDDFHSPLTLLCPPNGDADTYVWGTDVYRAGSSICVAAVHAGIITLDAGGRVTVTLQPKQEKFVARLRNGVSTQTWSGWDYQSYPQPYSVTPGAVTVTAPTSVPAREAGPRQVPGTSSDPSSSGPRTITLSGFTAAGSAPVIVPRTIPLKGFEATGTAPLIVPRSIPLDGWTGAGIAKQNVRR
jgi:hypothetical protein